MNIERKNHCVVISGVDSLQIIFLNRERIEGFLNENCLAVAVIPDGGLQLPENENEALEIANYFKKLNVLTAIASPSLQEVSYDVMTLFDIRLSYSPYMLDSRRVLSCEQKKSYEICCGQKAMNEYDRYIGNGSEGTFTTKLVSLLPENEDLVSNVCVYIENLFAGKDIYQNRSILSCFICARNGERESVLREESCRFYRLIKRKADISHDEI